ncbi:FAD-dependent oxidoreductase [Brevibacterium luteolum]|uniref:FAD-dependent oxidoreductase n=2 Tax=Brevibacterium luteolum TaxID=199591 RepID=UPI00223B9B7F|nr:FAD-dependent oxidoreductase [Brevibacterium luteolum]MCT1889865.1 FAD-dependent oxidoreductase [Brevibacterium luteolum]
MSRMETLAIIGAGLAGTECARAYVGGGGTADVILIDPRPVPSELPPLSKTLFADELNHVPLLRPDGIRLVEGEVTKVEADGRGLHLADGQRIDCNALVVAAGLRARRPQTELPGGPVHTIRSAADAEAIRAATGDNADIGVLGSGYLALEAARSAADAGHRVTVYLRGDRPLIGRHHEAIGRALMERHAKAGVNFLLDADPSDYTAHDVWIAAIGGAALTATLPEEWDRDASGHLLVDGSLRLTIDGKPAENVWALGDIAHLASGPLADVGPMESEATAASQGTWLGKQLAAGSTDEKWDDVPWHWSFQGPERVFAAGRVTGTDTAIVSGDEQSGRFQVLHFIDGVLSGVETLNQPPAHNAARKILALPPASRPTTSDAAGGVLDLRAWVRRLRS